MKIELAATAAFGLEAVVRREVTHLGYGDAHVDEGGRVVFGADLSGIPRANIRLRAADRVLLRLGCFTARTYDELFEGTLALPWPDWLPADACFPVVGKAVRSQLMSVSDCQAIVKKAVVESMKSHYGISWFPETGALHRIEISMLRDTATLSLDTSGPGLHKRGYRPLAAPAPLKETLAAALVLLSGWRPDDPLIDPCCGSGTIPIEAALIGANIAPGIKRAFAAEEWPAVPATLWEEVRAEAADAVTRRELHVTGSDLDEKSVELARQCATSAGIGESVTFAAADAAGLQLPGPGGVLIANPPYGERMGERREVEALYRRLGSLYRSSEGWRFYILNGHPAFERYFGRRADRRRKLYNGGIECQYYQYHQRS